MRTNASYENDDKKWVFELDVQGLRPRSTGLVRNDRCPNEIICNMKGPTYTIARENDGNHSPLINKGDTHMKKQQLLNAAFVGILAAGAVLSNAVADKAAAKAAEGTCKEANSCKGSGSCAGTAMGEAHKCKGQNTCGGNERKLTEADCNKIAGAKWTATAAKK